MQTANPYVTPQDTSSVNTTTQTTTQQTSFTDTVSNQSDNLVVW